MRKITSLMLLIGLAVGTVAQAQPPSLAEVDTWFYYLDVNLDDDTLAQVIASDYDLVVLDYIPSEAANADYDMAATVQTLQTAQHPKLVLAYIDIGQAESYRVYWEAGWGIGNPDWIISADPDGWDENYPVAYWYDEWQAIWLEEGGLLDGILAAGFDGVYLDWVEAYSDDSVLAFAQSEGLDPRQEMIWWVEDIAAHGRAADPDFLVIGQNASELLYEDDYRATIDAIAQEQVWFDGGADNLPPGDCPLPRTRAEVDSPDYVASLSQDCRRQYEDFPDSTLHVSSQGYLEDLSFAQAQGLPVLTVDYALAPDNVAWVMCEARRLGFVPFVGNRNLDAFRPIPDVDCPPT